MSDQQPKTLPALRVRQWLAEWDEIRWKPKERRSKPQGCFYLLSVAAEDLKALSGIYARTTNRTRASQDLGIQRRHEQDRSAEIRRFVRYGYPWSELSEAKRDSGDFKELRQPGWLPTAIVVNILTPNDRRLEQAVAEEDLVRLENGKGSTATLHLPKSYSGPDWNYSAIPPIEVIDGQHRLWAFESSDLGRDFELPVVAFVGLDISWQAYLFYTINIKPKKINASLAFDLYPLLRTEEWLDKFEGHIIYRETRAQELVDLLWSYPKSPWHHKINMLGETGSGARFVTQSAWVRSMIASLVKSWEGRGVSIGGLFGSAVGQHDTVLPWSRAAQAAFLIAFGTYFQEAVKASTDEWARSLRDSADQDLFNGVDAAFFGRHSLLNQDQGVRTLLCILNDACFVKADDLGLAKWGGGYEGSDEEQVAESLTSLRKQKTLAGFLKDLAERLATYDWRASSAPGLPEADRKIKAGFRGSGGYKELRKDVLSHLSDQGGDIGTTAQNIIKSLGY